MITYNRYLGICFALILGFGVFIIVLSSFFYLFYPDDQIQITIPNIFKFRNPFSVNDLLTRELPPVPLELEWEHSEDKIHHGSDLEAQILKKKVRVLCWVMTNPTNHRLKAIHVKRTWGKRCNKLLILSSENDTELGVIKLNNVQEGRTYLWEKTREAFKFIYDQKYLNDYDWFMKADDDTFVIVENLRYMLKDVDPNTPIYYGCKFKPYSWQGYMSGGAGYVLSREAVKRFVEIALHNSNLCPKGFTVWDHEDVNIGRCLEKIGVIAGDSRDQLGRYRFNPFDPHDHLIPGLVEAVDWYDEYIYYPQGKGLSCCSGSAITFHYVAPNTMYILDYLLYHLHPYGIHSNNLLNNSTKLRK